MRVHRVPKLRTGALVTFAKIDDAVNAVVEVKHSLNTPSLVRCELLNAEAVAAGNKEFKTQLAATPTILLELQGDDLDAMRQEYTAVSQLFQRHGAQPNARYYEKGSELDDVWEARRGCYMASRKVRGNRKPDAVYISDVCVPMSALARCVGETEADFAAAGVPCIICAHIADGNFHAMVPFGNDVEKKRVLELEMRLIDRALKNGGAVSGEHGVGVGKVKHLLREHGRAHVEVQQAIKNALDPHNLMNPGKFYYKAPPSSTFAAPTSRL